MLDKLRKRAGNWAKRVFGVRFFIRPLSGVSAAGLVIFGIVGGRKHPAYVMAADSPRPGALPPRHVRTPLASPRPDGWFCALGGNRMARARLSKG
jgi:hypothetical protein